jgi:hypothetical protein
MGIEGRAGCVENVLREQKLRLMRRPPLRSIWTRAALSSPTLWLAASRGALRAWRRVGERVKPVVDTGLTADRSIADSIAKLGLRCFTQD